MLVLSKGLDFAFFRVIQEACRFYSFLPGKFQMHVFPNCGHTVHEDAPYEVGDAVINFS